MNKFKIGQKVRIKGDKDIGIIFDTNDDVSLVNFRGNSCYYFNNILEPIPRTIEYVQERDLITNGNNFRRVLGVCGKAVFCTSYWNKGEKEKIIATNFIFSIQELKDNNWSIVDESEPKPIKEVTMKDVIERFGEEVKIIKE